MKHIDKQRRFFDLFNNDEEKAKLGEYIKPIDPNKKTNDELICYTEKEKKKIKLMYILCGFFIFLIFIPPIFRLVDPKYYMRSKEYRLEQANKKIVHISKLSCELHGKSNDGSEMSSTFSSIYYDDERRNTIVKWDYANENPVAISEEVRLKDVNAILSLNTLISDVKYYRNKNHFEIRIIKSDKVQNYKELLKFTNSIKVVKDNMENDSYICKILNLGTKEISKKGN